jgi:hypothetical protein
MLLLLVDYVALLTSSYSRNLAAESADHHVDHSSLTVVEVEGLCIASDAPAVTAEGVVAVVIADLGAAALMHGIEPILTACATVGQYQQYQHW